MTFTHVYFDIGGVLGTNGWDREQRAAAVRRFGLDAADLEDRHAESVALLEQGRMTLDEYLRCTVFYRPRPFSAAEFKACMLAQSVPFPETIEVARELARSGRYRLMTINNESDELNRYRLEQFGLRGMFVAFFSSCWVGTLQAGPSDLRSGARDGPGGSGGVGVHRRPAAEPGARQEPGYEDHSDSPTPPSCARTWRAWACCT